MKENNTLPTKVFALGGLGEVGKNMYVVEYDNEIIVIDAGVMFPEDELLGIDYVLADFNYLKQNENKVKCLIITHGHEDHIGGISFLLEYVNIPVIYAPNIAAKLIQNKLEDRNVKFKNIKVYTEDTIIKIKNMSVEFFATTHSIPDSYGMCIHTPNGNVVTTGDFKFDLTPVGPMANIGKMAKIGAEGVRLLLSDSTNALNEGFSKSESTVDESLGEIFRTSEGRVIIATFASNIYRLTHIVETCKKNNRKIATFGRSMKTSIEIALDCGYITDKNIFVTADEANRMNKKEVCLLCTGSQGEALAALSRIANGNDKFITLMPDDIVVFSSSPIPGNALSINRVINKLYLKGATVFTKTDNLNVHTSGHAKAEELKLLIRLMKPECFMPVHGEFRMLKAHADLAQLCDVKKENIFVCENGDVLNLYKDTVVKEKNKIPVYDIYVDGSRVGDIKTNLIKDRKLMSNEGVLIIVLNINPYKKELIIKPNVTTRGFIIVNENLDLIKDIETKVENIVKKELDNYTLNYTDMKNQIILEVNSYVNELTGRRPIIIPVILEIKKM